MLGKLFLITILAFSFFADNCNKNPSESETAKRGFTVSQPIVDALENYYQDNKNYPQSLPQLVPKYLKEFSPKNNGLSYAYHYKELEKSFELEFTFSESGLIGISECSYYSETKKWSCIKKM
jgi:hypothetical protein